VAQHGLVGDMKAPVDVTYLADTVLLLRYFEAMGNVRRAVSVIKKRSGKHEKTIREFEIDTGSRGGLILMHPFAASNGLVDHYHATRLVTVGYGVGGPSKALLARAGELTIGGTTISAPVTELIADQSGAAAQTQTAGNIGGDLLKRYTVTLDYAHQLMWLQPNELAHQREVFDRAGVWIARAKDGGIEVLDVANESAAARTGLSPGDVILAVNGKAARDLALYELREQFKGAAGTPFKLQVRGKQGERDLTLTLADQV